MSEKNSRLKQIKFRVDFSVKDEGRLSPIEGNKPKDTVITLLRQIQFYYLSAILVFSITAVTG